MDEPRYFVAPDREEGWTVALPGGPTYAFETREEAVDWARARAGETGGGLIQAIDEQGQPTEKFTVEPQAVITLDLDASGQTLTFTSFDEFRGWLREQNAQWSWLGEHANIGPVGTAINARNNAIKQVERAATAVASAAPEDMAARLTNLENTLTRQLSRTTFIDRTGPRARYIERLREESPAIAASAYAWFTGHGFTTTAESLEGAFRALQYESGIETGVEDERARLKALLVEGSSDFAKLMERLQGSLSGAQSELRELEQERGELKRAARKLIDGSGERLADFEAAYEKKLALQAPVDYWTKQASKHRTGMMAWGITFAILAVSLLGLVVFLGPELRELLIPPESDIDTAWALGVLALLGALVVWIIRMPAKLFLSHVHLRQSAEEKAVMANTYLALLKTGDPMTADDRNLIFTLLFRPAATGILKDDLAPETLASILSRTK